MSVMTTGDAWPAVGPITVAELDRIPYDGRRYELLDGVLVVSPRPTTVHQWVATRLIGVLLQVCPEDKFGVPSHWIVDPGPGRPELTVFELRDGHYALAAQTTQAVTLSRPFSVTVNPADLTRGLRG